MCKIALYDTLVAEFAGFIMQTHLAIPQVVLSTYFRNGVGLHESFVNLTLLVS
jgi:hypothetical protein